MGHAPPKYQEWPMPDAIRNSPDIGDDVRLFKAGGCSILISTDDNLLHLSIGHPASWRAWQTRPWIGLLYGTILNPSMASRGAAVWIASLPRRHVSPSASQAKAPATATIEPGLAAEAQSRLRGVFNGLAGRNDRLELTGNGVVPVVAAVAFLYLCAEAGVELG